MIRRLATLFILIFVAFAVNAQSSAFLKVNKEIESLSNGEAFAKSKEDKFTVYFDGMDIDGGEMTIYYTSRYKILRNSFDEKRSFKAIPENKSIKQKILDNIDNDRVKLK